MSAPYLVKPVTGPIRGTVRPPGSKSLTNRALITAALASGTTTLTGVLDSDDTRVMVDSLRKLGMQVEHDLSANRMTVTGCGGKPGLPTGDLWLENSGTSIRFLTALCALGEGTYRLDGNKRMRERPIDDLVEALHMLSVDVQCELGTRCPPVVVHAKGLAGGKTEIDGDVSSQFLSGLLMAAPCARQGLEIHVRGELVSQPYVDMTLGVMAQFGVTAGLPQHNIYRIPPQKYRATQYDIEPDASAASYFFGLAAITGGSITVEGLSNYALQGDVAFVEALQQMGCKVDYSENSITVHGGALRGIDIDMNAISDTAQTMAVVALFADGPTTIRNVGHMRHKETDRISALVTEIQRMGGRADDNGDGLTIHPTELHAASIATYDDHRMAMSFALAGLKVPGIQIEDPACTGKTYPNFFDDIERICANSSS